jgi:hypothetical protein
MTGARIRAGQLLDPKDVRPSVLGDDNGSHDRRLTHRLERAGVNLRRQNAEPDPARGRFEAVTLHRSTIGASFASTPGDALSGSRSRPAYRPQAVSATANVSGAECMHQLLGAPESGGWRHDH